MKRAPGRAWFLIRHGVESLVETAGTREAAQVAFFIMITFPAALLLLVWGASTALDDTGVRAEIVDAIIDVLPLSDDEGRAQVEDLLDGVAEGAGTLGMLGGLVLIWSASGAFGALRYSIGAAWPSGEGLPYFQGKALDVALTLTVAPVLRASRPQKQVDGIADAFSNAPLLEGLISIAVTQIVPAAAVFGVLLVLYRILPPADASWRSAWVGALVAFTGVVLVRYGAELYFGTIGDSAAIYGAIAGLLAVAISVYLLAIVAVVGANVAAVSARYESWRAVDDEIRAEAERDDGEGSAWADIRGMVRGLFLRARQRD
jgi:YihY family inner membrane protein